ncbi:hypothetical protein [Escherichia coli]|uniref:hypothetical protein n=1 Tax=Escherichia coli TaxID=562 RepID=UPI000BDF38C2|nr:hypothetical protein [Escherichia coli]
MNIALSPVSSQPELFPLAVMAQHDYLLTATSGLRIHFYSALRPHEYNGGLPPNESENRYWKKSEIVTSFC